MIEVFKVALVQGTVFSQSLPRPAGATMTGTLSLALADRADPGLSVLLWLEALIGGAWVPQRPVAVWHGGPSSPVPSVTHSAAGDYVRLAFSPSRPVSAGASLSFA